MSDELTIKGDVEVLRLQPGDIIVVTLDGRHGREAVSRIGEQVRERFPDHEVLVADGVRLSIQRDETAAA